MTRRSIRVAGAALLSIAALAACTPATSRTTFPPLGASPRPAGDATAATKQEGVDTLRGVGLQPGDSVRAFRPPE